MSVLADSQIRRLAETEGLVAPYNPDMIQPASLEVTLGGDHVVAWRPVAASHACQWEQVKLPLPYEMLRGDYVVIATTAETIRMPTNLVGVFSGKSSLGRMGISTHITAGWIDPGFHGQITLELLNESPVPFRLDAGMKIGQISFRTLLGPVLRPYGTAGNHYQDQRGPTLANEASLKRPQGEGQ